MPVGCDGTGVDSFAQPGTMAGMEDIARRLRSWVKHELQESDPASVILQAADEIERLRTQGNGLAERVGSLFRETQELYRHIATQQPWIAVSERKPDADKVVFTDGKNITIATRYESGAYDAWDVWEKMPTHWMPLPEPPEVK